MMNLDDVMEGWRSQDASTFYGVDKTRLHQALRQEQAKLRKESRWGTRGGYVASSCMFIIAGLFFGVMIARTDEGVLMVWDYVVAVAGMVAASVVVWTLFALRRSQHAREQGFGDSLRDHLRRRIAQIDDEATGERRLGLIALAAGLICAVAIPVADYRTGHVPVPYSEMDWPLPLPAVLIFGLLCVELFWWAPRRERRKNLPRKRKLEALLKELDGQ